MTQLAVGDVLEGRYRIDHPIARGGMATVYRCVDLRLGRAVAAKVMHPHVADDPASRQRFRREARAMAQLSHPNLVSVYDFSSNEQGSFLIMELITGGTLRELLAERGPMPPHAAVAVLRAMLTGLSAAHIKSMVHRDIKPDNVLIDEDHRVKVADFGLVRSAANPAHTSNEIIGTVSYLSPEQVDGSEITPASDVYSAGVVLFELLTGTVPFTGDSQLARAFARLKEDVPSPSSRIDGVPPLLNELVATATARDADDRFHDAADFLAALDDVAAELALPAFTVPVPRNSAANRAAAVPTDTTGILETTHLGPKPTAIEHRETTVLDEDMNGENPETLLDVPRPEATPDPTALLPAAGALGAAAAGPVPVPAPMPAAGFPPHPYAPPQAPAPSDSHTNAPITNRSGFAFWVGFLFAVVMIGGVLVGGWWFGSGRYGEVPLTPLTVGTYY